jgi:hypothetical protein
MTRRTSSNTRRPADKRWSRAHGCPRPTVGRSRARSSPSRRRQHRLPPDETYAYLVPAGHSDRRDRKRQRRSSATRSRSPEVRPRPVRASRGRDRDGAHNPDGARTSSSASNRGLHAGRPDPGGQERRLCSTSCVEPARPVGRDRPPSARFLPRIRSLARVHFDHVEAVESPSAPHEAQLEEPVLVTASYLLGDLARRRRAARRR